MELIRISDRKLKLMLTPTDMSHFELNSEAIGENPSYTHRSLCRLLAELRDRVGFDGDDRHLSVQYFPSREGGCEMFICNLEENETTGGNAMATKSQDTGALRLCSPKRVSDCFRRELAYRFDTLNDLLTVCNRLRQLGYICESSAYRDGHACYFLFLVTLAPSPFSIPDELGFIVEYGRLENASSLLLYAREHATVICRTHAVEQLAELS